MNNKLICNQIDYIHTSGVLKMDESQFIVKSGKKLQKLLVEDRVEYSCALQQTDAGALKNETIKVKVKYDSNLSIIESAYKFYILKLYTDSGSFFVGNKDYPAELTYSEDKVYLILTFKSSRPIY